jgi:hypothetical protein
VVIGYKEAKGGLSLPSGVFILFLCDGNGFARRNKAVSVGVHANHQVAVFDLPEAGSRWLFRPGSKYLHSHGFMPQSLNSFDSGATMVSKIDVGCAQERLHQSPGQKIEQVGPPNILLNDFGLDSTTYQRQPPHTSLAPLTL